MVLAALMLFPRGSPSPVHERRPGLRVAVTAAAATVAVVVAGAGSLAWDASRPAGQRTHIGRFARELGGTQAIAVIARKAGAAAGSLTSSPYTVLVIAAALGGRCSSADGCSSSGVLAMYVHQRGHGPRVSGVIGSLVNDSGVVVLGITLAVTAPCILAACLPLPEGSRAL